MLFAIGFPSLGFDTISKLTRSPSFRTALFGVTEPETAIRWLVLFMMLAVDPLAIALTWSVAARRRVAAA
jgi:hypothetical protein